MRRRHSTRVRSSPQRRKSTSSACSVQLEHLDASVAQRDATTAAAQAFTRSQERPSADMSLFPPPPPPPPPPLLPTPTKASRYATPPIQDGNRRISREQSVRFVRPQAARSNSKRTGSSNQTDVGAGEDDETTLLATPAPSGKVEESQPPRLRVLQSTENLRTPKGLGEKEQPYSGHRLTSSYLNTLSAGDEYYTPEDDIASAPSSYRRLRPSRSRSRLGQGSSTEAATDEPGISYFANNSPDRRRLQVSSKTPRELQEDTDKENRFPPNRSLTPSLRAPKSMSFLRTGRQRAASSISQDESNTTDYRSETLPIEPRRLRSQPSLFFRSRSKRSHAGSNSIRKSLRSNSSGSAVPTTISRDPLPLTSTKNNSLKSRARKASKSLKSKLKSFFNLSKTETGPTGLPEQHIESQRTHVSGIIDSLQSIANGHGHVDIPDQCSLSRVPSNVASFHAVPAEQRLRSRQGSFESLRSEKETAADEKSRVTSWSSGPTTIASQQQLQQTWSEWERQRLSVIKEHGTHSPSPSLQRPGVSTPPVRGHDGGPSILPGPTIDSQRVYSALMKRLRETEQLAQISEQQTHSSDDYCDPFRTESMGSESGWSKRDAETQSTPTPPTIRRVTPSYKDLKDPRTDEAFYTHPQGTSSASTIENPWADQQPKTGRKRSSSSVSYTPYPHAVAGDGRGLSPSIELVPRREAASPAGSRAALSDRSSAIFASPTRHLFRTTSPFRRALQESMHAVEHEIHSQKQILEDSFANTIGHAPSERTGSRGSGFNGAAYSDSVYSYHARDKVPDSAKIRALVDEFPEPPGMLGDANVVFTDPALVYSPASRQPGSSASSVDWKMWLAANTAKLEPELSPERSERALGVEYVVPRMPNPFAYGHRRERAQICAEDDDDRQSLALPTRMPSLPTTPLSHASSRQHRTTPAPRPVQNAVSPVDATQLDQPEPRLGTPCRAFEEAVTDSSELPPPPIPPKSELRSMYSPSLASVRSGCRVATHCEASQAHTPERGLPVTRSKSVARMRSLNQMHAMSTGSPQAPMSSSRSKLPRRMGRTIGCSSESLTSSPGLTAAVERQFGSISQRVESLTSEKENIRAGGDLESSPVCSPTSRGQDGDAQVMGSKRMVDLFLSSRRRRMVSTEESGAFI